MGKWTDKRCPLLQCGYWILVSRGAWKSDMLACTWCGRSGSYCLVKSNLLSAEWDVLTLLKSQDGLLFASFAKSGLFRCREPVVAYAREVKNKK